MYPCRPRSAVALFLLFFSLCLTLPAVAQTPPSTDSATVVLWQPGDPGQRLNLRGRVLNSKGEPLAGVTIYLRQADGTGAYQYDRYRAAFQTDAEGSFRLATVLPGQYSGAKHIHATLEHPGYATLDTQILFRGDTPLEESLQDRVVVLEEVRIKDETLLVGLVEFVLRPLGSP